MHVYPWDLHNLSWHLCLQTNEFPGEEKTKPRDRAKHSHMMRMAGDAAAESYPTPIQKGIGGIKSLLVKNN
jgi:hypothetical protein